MESTEWKDKDNFFVKDDILKQIKGYDSTLFSVDMLRKICNKLGIAKYLVNIFMVLFRVADAVVLLSDFSNQWYTEFRNPTVAWVSEFMLLVCVHVILIP
jgi:hypothetical protein